MPDDWPSGAPRPGDPASRGPKPRGGLRDGLWLAATVTLLVVTALQVVRLVVRVATDPDVQVGGTGALLGFLVTLVWFLFIYWLAAGAWRRSVWGCPFEHTEDAAFERRCPRHGSVPTPR